MTTFTTTFTVRRPGVDALLDASPHADAAGRDLSPLDRVDVGRPESGASRDSRDGGHAGRGHGQRGHRRRRHPEVRPTAAPARPAVAEAATPESTAGSSLADGYRNAEPYLAACSTLVASVIGFTALGYWLDRRMGHSVQWLLLLGAAVGMVVGFVSFFRKVLPTGGRR